MSVVTKASILLGGNKRGRLIAVRAIQCFVAVVVLKQWYSTVPGLCFEAIKFCIFRPTGNVEIQMQLYCPGTPTGGGKRIGS